MNCDAREGQPRSPQSATRKQALRRILRGRRASRSPDPVGNQFRTDTALAACSQARTVAAYVSTPTEPDTTELLEALRLNGVSVLLPVLRANADWAWYEGPEHLVSGPKGILQPVGPAIGADGLRCADWIWIPGLSGTPRGNRLGTGGGWYDRALAWAAPDAVLGLLLFDDEVLDDVPLEPWDRSVHLIVTERRRIDCRPE